MRKIIILDDEEDIALMFKEGLEIMGFYNVATYNDPIKALHEIKSISYDVILIDIVMPNMNGLEFYKI